MMRSTHALLPLLLTATLAIHGCGGKEGGGDTSGGGSGDDGGGDDGGGDDGGSDLPPEGTNAGECTDGADNDADGLFDCNDPDCAGSPDCSEANTPGGCSDGADNDADGLFDCDDPDCVGDEACGDDIEGNDAGECEDGIDNDGDGLTDCEDDDCAGFEGCDDYEGDEPGECTDGEDNDSDGLTDCDDDGCEGSPDCEGDAVGSEANPGSSCEDILDRGGSDGDRVYWIDPEGSGAFEAYCDMTTDGGGWTEFFAGINGKGDVFATFQEGADNCTSPGTQCLRMLPSTVGTGDEWAASCGGATLALVLNTDVHSFFSQGTMNAWVATTAARVVSGSLGSGVSGAALWTGSATFPTGWIIAGGDELYSTTFASNYIDLGSGRSAWEYCNGIADSTSPIRLMYR